MITLSQQEMDKFAVWLEQEAESSEGAARQMEALKVPEIVSRKFKAEAAAYRIVAGRLKTTEVQKIQGGN
jgi:hypothetical protein